MRKIKFAEKQIVMIGGIASAAMKIGSGIFGGIKAAKEAKKQKEMVEQSKRENEAWFNRRYNEDATQRADAQRMLTYVNDSIKNQNRTAAGTAAVAGGSTEAVAAQKAASNAALSGAASNITAQADARKDAIEQQYQANKESYNQQLRDISRSKTDAITQAIGGVSAAADTIGGMNFGKLDKN